MAILSFLKADSGETPYQVVKGVMRLATQLKVKGYKGVSGRYRDHNRSDDDDDDDDDDIYGSSSMYDSDSDESELGDRRTSGRRKERLEKGERSRRLKRRRERSKERRSYRNQSDEGSVRGEVRELREMMRDLMKLQKGATATEGAKGHPENDIIPLDNYAIAEGYGRYTPSARNPYGQRDTFHPTTQRLEYPNRRSYAPPATTYDERQRESYAPFFDGRRPGTRRAGPPPPSTFYERARQPIEDTRFTQAPGGYSTSRAYEGTSTVQPIVGPNGALYYPARPGVCFHCGEEGHYRPQCPKLHGTSQRAPILSEHPNTLPREIPPSQTRTQPVSVVEVAVKSSALEGVKVCQVATAGADSTDLRNFVHKLTASETQDDGSSEDSDDGRDGVPVMAGERVRRFSELPEEFEGEAAPPHQRQKTRYDDDDDDAAEVTLGKRKIKPAISKTTRRPIRMMAGREKFDFVGAFRDAPVTGLSWGSFFDLAPSVKKDICHLLVQERGKRRGKGKGKAKRVTIDTEGEEAAEAAAVQAVASDRNLGNVANFYTKGIIPTGEGEYRISRILVDAGSVVNLMPIHLLRFIGAKLSKAGGMVIRTATNALAQISYCADIRITIAGVACNLRVYALPEEYQPTYPLLLSRRWLQAVKAKGDYASGRYYIMHTNGMRVQIPSDRSGTISPQRHHPRVPIVMRDRNKARQEVSAEVEEELEWQRSGGNNFFERLVEFIKQQAQEQMRREDEEEEDSEDSFSDTGESEN